MTKFVANDLKCCFFFVAILLVIVIDAQLRRMQKAGASGW